MQAYIIKMQAYIVDYQTNFLVLGAKRADYVPF